MSSLSPVRSSDGSLKPTAADCSGGSGQSVTDGQTKKKVHFNMVRMPRSKLECEQPVGTLLDDGAPYSGIGHQELKMMQEVILLGWDGKFEKLPETVRHCPHYWIRYVNSLK